MLRDFLPESIRQHIKSPLYRNSFFLMLDTVVTVGLGFFFWMVVARFYTEEEVGLGAATISAISLLALLSRLGLGPALIRFLPKAENPVSMINSCLVLSGTVALALAVISLGSLHLWSPALAFIKENILFVMVFIVFTVMRTISLVADSVFIAQRKAEFVLSKRSITSLLKIPLPILLVLFFQDFGIVTSWGIALLVSLAITFFVFLPRVVSHYRPAPSLNFGIIGRMWRYPAGNYLTVLFATAPTLVLPIIVVNLIGAEHNAYFYVAWMVAHLLFAIPYATAQSLFAEGSHFEEELWVNVRKSLRLIFRLLVPAIILLLLSGGWLLSLFGEGYSINGLPLLQVLVISSVFVALNSVYYSILRVEHRIGELAAITGLIAVSVLLGSYFIAPATGIASIGYIWLTAQGIISLYVIWSMIRSYRARQASRQP